jgi:hypothetical protein
MDVFVPLLNKIRLEGSLDTINLSNLLSEINGQVGVESKYTLDELKSYLTILEKDNRVMVTWEDGMIYWI